MKKNAFKSIIALLMAAFMLAGCGTGAKTEDTQSAETTMAETTVAETTVAETKAPVVREDGVLLMATTTSTEDTGLLDYLQPLFKEDTGIDLQWTAVGTGAALQMGMDGEVDVVLVHAKASEEEFVAGGYGVERFQVMYNDFVIVGPTDGPVAVNGDIAAVFKQIKEEELTFVSRGDDSGTHKKELGIWTKLEIEDYESNPNYLSAGAGMGDTLNMASEKSGYCLTDRGTWLAKRADYPDMSIICEGDANLLNQYGVIAVNPEMYPDVNNEAANAFIEWIRSEKVQAMIAEYGVDQYGEALFTPNANE